MGGSESKTREKFDNDGSRFVERIKATVEDELARKAMVQREVQMAVNMAKTRDTIWIFGSTWALFVIGVNAGRLAGRKTPPIVGVPIVVGALVLGNMADMAYGNKMARVIKEAEYILDHERGRFVPFRQVSVRPNTISASLRTSWLTLPVP